MAGSPVALVFGVVVVMLHSGPSVQKIVSPPDTTLEALSNSGTAKLTEEVRRLQKAYVDSRVAIQQASQSCNRLLQPKANRCQPCVDAACEKRVKKVCQPSVWEKMLAKGIKFFTKDVPKLLENSVKGVFVDGLGKAVVDVGAFIKDLKEPIKYAGKKVVSGVGDVGKTVVEGVVNVGKGIGHVGEEIGHSVVHGGEELGHHIVHLGKEIGDGIDHIGKEIEKGVHHVFHEIGHIIGKRVVNGYVVIVPRAASEPGCDAIQSSNGCDYYYNTCADCTLDRYKECPGFKTAMEKHNATFKAQDWLNDINDWKYEVISVRADSGSFDPAAFAYKKVDVKLTIMGQVLSFSVSQPVNPIDTVSAGPAIAMQALKLRKPV